MGAIIEGVLGRLLAGRAATGQGDVSLDVIGEAIGVQAVTAEEIAWLIDALEARGFTVGGAPAPSAIAGLRKVVPAARALRERLGRSPTSAEIADEAGLGGDEVRRALLLARVMSR